MKQSEAHPGGVPHRNAVLDRQGRGQRHRVLQEGVWSNGVDAPRGLQWEDWSRRDPDR